VRVEFRTSFTRDLRRIRDRALRQRVQETIEEVEAAESLPDIVHLQKLRAEGHYYRIRLGDYRIGLIVEVILSVSFDVCIDATSIVTSHNNNQRALLYLTRQKGAGQVAHSYYMNVHNTGCHHNSSSSALASMRSAVSNPSVNQL
jgi:mRNA interferase RelE/StbE